MTIPIPSPTPNVVVENPDIRRIISTGLAIAGALVGTAIVVDGASAAFDITAWTGPISAGLLYLGSVIGAAVTIPNIPRAIPKQDVTVIATPIDPEQDSGI